MSLCVESFDCCDSGDSTNEMTCCMCKMGLLKVDIALHPRCNKGNDDDNYRQRRKDNQRQ